ncbi:hypothetical protein ACW0JX_12640 [Bacillus sp. C-3-6]
MEGQELTLEKKDSVYLRPRYPYKIDASKIKSLKDEIKILGLMHICLGEKAVIDLERLIEKEEE